MRAAMYYNNRDIRLEEVPTPAAGPGELLVKIESSGICGSDVMEWYRIHKAPLILGHEIAGEVVAAGEGVTSFQPGDRVAATHHVPCNTCHFCLTGHETVCDTLLSGTHFDPGGFCEYVRLPAINVDRGTWKIPDSLSYDSATFVEPLACILRGQRTARLKQGSSVLVLGSGLAGLMHLALAKASGAGFIGATDMNDFRLQAAQRFGASLAIKADQDVASLFRKHNKGLGADLVIVCTSATPAFEQAFRSVERGGTILFFAPTMDGVTLPLSINNMFWRRDITFTTTYAGSPADCVTALDLIANARIPVEEMITHRFGLADAGEGFRLTAEGADSLKVIIRPQE
ncbi:MAG: zinc-dependent dehydrogenase [Proteobacteria bacterium]|nr:zinc-dependent dehydrogenase [Pseudomonadota bacterium]MBU1738916.1 zinc-dependent dehydrogenase [Pseudomonadota bacterium]